MRRILLTFFFALQLSGVLVQAQTIRYVTPDGTGSGGSWGDPTNLADALRWAYQNRNNNLWSEADPLQIWVSNGVHYPRYDNSGNFVGDAARENTFTLVSNVQLYGGFQVGETTLADRVLPADRNFQTILSGDYDGNDNITGSGENLVISGNDENVWGVLQGRGDLGVAVVDGFQVTGGHANHSTDYYIGSGLRVDNAEGLSVRNVLFSGNVSTGSAGAVFVNNSSAGIAIEDCDFRYNYGGQGGGGLTIFSSGGTTVRNSRFMGNYAGGEGGGLRIAGSGAEAPEVSNCTFSRNYGGSGGAIYASSDLLVRNSLVFDNIANYGGGLFLRWGGPLTVVNSTIVNNVARAQGGAMSTRYSNENNIFNIFNCIVLGNTSELLGGEDGVYLEDSSSDVLIRRYSLVQGFNGTANGNLSAAGVQLNQVFQNPATNDFRLLSSSPCVNAGSNALYNNNGGGISIDLDGQNRFFGPSIDVGAYELQQEPTLPTVPGCATNITPANNALDVPVDADITWDAVTGADGYYVSIGTTPGGTDIANNEDVTTGTTYDHPNDFDENTVYYVRVVPYNAEGSATGCAEISFTTEELLDAPDCTTIIFPTDGAVDVPLNAAITWDPVAGADGYRISIGTTLGGTDIADDVDITVVTSFNPPADFPENETIYVSVVPYNAAGEAAGCGEISFTTVARPEPPQAGNQQFCPQATVADLVAAGTDIRWYDQATGGTALSTTTALSTGTYYATQTAGGMESDRRAVAVTVEAPSAPQFNGDINGCGNLTVADLEDMETGLRWYSQATGGTALSSTEVVSSGTYYASRVSGACESDRTAVQVIISVTPVPDVPDQRFVAGSTFADLDVTGQNLQWYTEPTGSTPFDPQTVITNGTYYVSQTIDGCESNRVIVQINITSVPNCATNITPADNATNVPVDANISWDAVADADGYYISIGTTSGGTDIADNEDITTGTTYNLPVDFEENTTYYVTVVPYNAAGSATGCPEISFTTETILTAPGCAMNITPSNNATDVPVDANITWDIMADADGYRIFIGTTPGGNDLVDNADVSGTSFNPPINFPQGETIYVTVVPYNAAGEATGCAEISFITEELLDAPGCTTITSPTDDATDVSLRPTITWTVAANATGYRLSIGTTLTGGEVLNGDDVGNVTSYTLTVDLAEDTDYYVLVVPYNGVGDATGCTGISFTTVARPEPPQAGNQQFCPQATVADLVAVGTDIRWYDQATGGAALSTTTALSTGTYYATQTAGGMESDRRAVAVTVEAPSAPQFNGDINGCGNLTVADLEDMETGLRWYSQATGGTALSSTEVVSSGTYYASRVSGACESDRTAVQVIISVTPVPDVPDQRFVVGSTFADLNIIGQNLRWYSEPSGSTPFDPQTVISNGTYYVSQTIDGCESNRVIVQINITPIPDCVMNISPADNATNVSVDANITWDAVAEAAGYRISVGTTPGGTDIADNVDVSVGTSFDPPVDFPQGETIYVAVVPYNAVGSATGCSEISFTTEEEELPPPVAPECTVITSPTDGATDVPLDAVITWSPVGEADGYRIYVGTATGDTDVIDGEEVTGTSYNLTGGFDENTTYYFTVVPFNAVGEATGCAGISFTTEVEEAPLPEVPGCTVITNPVDRGDAPLLESGITWIAVAGADGYRVSIGTTPGNGDLVNGVEVGGTVYHPAFEFAENTTYYITVVPFNAAGAAAGCGQFRFSIIPDDSINRTKYGISPNGDGINDYWSIDGIEQYPDNTVSIFNRWGDMVFQIHGYDNEFKVFNGVANKLTRLGGGVLPAGTYFFTIQYGDGKEIKTVEGFLVLRR